MPGRRPRLGVLDQCPRPAGSGADTALAASLDLARQAEALGYHRYWMAEHHNSPGLACTTPAVVLAALSQHTERIRLGSGGVLLPYYSPLAVAEAFTLLGALAPGRVDVGVGRAAGADPETEAALRYHPDRPAAGHDDFPERLVDLVALLGEARSLAGVAGHSPPVWVLGSSSQGAGQAAYLGLPFAFAHFITERFGPQIVRSYRRGFRPGQEAEPRVVVAVNVTCAPRDDQARHLATSAELAWLRRGRADQGPMLDPDEATAELGRLAELDRARLDQRRAATVVGDPGTVVARLESLVADHEADELLVLTNCHEAGARLRSYELVAEAWGLGN